MNQKKLEGHQAEINRGDRFEFGANWARFLADIDESRIQEAENSLKDFLDLDHLTGRTFLDIGSGSGLSSLAARRLGARVHSFDYDPESVACTKELHQRYCPEDTDWTIESGSVLDGTYMESLGYYDVVYSWGVLHHTGAMWVAIEHALQRVGPQGLFFIALYNDQGAWSRVWWLIKYLYNKLPGLVKPVYGFGVWYGIIGLNILKYTLKLQPMKAISPLLSYKPSRGMSVRHDVLDWMGGFPFEFVRWDVLVDFMAARGFHLVKGVPNSGIGCHQMVFMNQNK